MFLYLVILTLSPTLNLRALWLDSSSSGKAKLSAWVGFLAIEQWYAYGLLDLAATDTDKDSKYVCIDHVLRNVGGIVDMEGKPKYQKLVTFVNFILTFSHGNADFQTPRSISNYMQTRRMRIL